MYIYNSQKEKYIFISIFFLYSTVLKSMKRNELKLSTLDNKYKCYQILQKYSFYNTINSP